MIVVVDDANDDEFNVDDVEGNIEAGFITVE